MSRVNPSSYQPTTRKGGSYDPSKRYSGGSKLYMNAGGGKGGNTGGGGKGGKGGGGGGGGHHGGKGGGGGFSLSMKDLFGLGMNLAHPQRQAQRDIKLLYQPQISGLKNDYTDYANQMGALYTVLGNQIGDVGKGAQADFSKTNADYTKGTQDILGSLAQTTAPDQAAFLKVLGSQALAGSSSLAQQGMNEGRYNAAMGEQAGLENTILQRNAAGDLNNSLESLRTQRATDLRTRLDDLRQQAFERMLALKQFQLNAAASQSALAGDKASRKAFQQILGGALGMGSGHHHNGGGGGGGGGTHHTGGGGTTNKPPKKHPKNPPGHNTRG